MLDAAVEDGDVARAQGARLTARGGVYLAGDDRNQLLGLGVGVCRSTRFPGS